VHVSAKDKATGKEQAISIKACGGLSDAEVERMVQDAAEHAEEDKKRKELVQERNAAHELVNSANKMLSEHADKISEDMKTDIKANADELQKMAESDDIGTIKQQAEKLLAVMSKAGEIIHKAAQEQAGTSQQQASPNAEQDNVVDADYTVQNDESK